MAGAIFVSSQVSILNNEPSAPQNYATSEAFNDTIAPNTAAAAEEDGVMIASAVADSPSKDLEANEDISGSSIDISAASASDQPVPTIGQFNDKIVAAIDQFASIYQESGMSGAEFPKIHISRAEQVRWKLTITDSIRQNLIGPALS